MFLPTTKEEITAKGWQQPDIILITGDTYIDSPFMGIALIGKFLTAKGFRVAVIAQPDVSNGKDITRLGIPRLFWGVSGGAVDSMVANYTASGKRRKRDDYTPGGINNRRPDRAVIAYCNAVRRYCKGGTSRAVPIVLGGIEASLRRIAHYDFSSNTVRRSILFDARADYLCFGMAHESVLLLAEALRAGDLQAVRRIRGVGFIAKDKEMGEKSAFPVVQIPSFEEVCADRNAFGKSFRLFYENTNPHKSTGLCQKHGDRWLLLNPPPFPSSSASLDYLHELDYERDVHPFYGKNGVVRALDTLRFSIPTHYGCYGECNFCAIAVHQGREVVSRSIDSIVREAEGLAARPDFKGYIHDLGGATANMYGYECAKKQRKGACRNKRCLFPTVCPSLRPNHKAQLELLQRLEKIPKVKKIFIASGIRHDLILADRRYGNEYLRKLCKDHISGQLKLAPEHSCERILRLMGKETIEQLVEFKRRFDAISQEEGRKQYLTYYFIEAHPGCTIGDMQDVRKFCQQKLHILPEQVQIFTPTPSTWSTVMYYLGCDPFSGDDSGITKDEEGKGDRRIFVERQLSGKEKQKRVLLYQQGERREGSSSYKRGKRSGWKKNRRNKK